ncbi:GNAT family N-acetyltransferase [Nocardioides pocheonensis]|uniref:GNAT family N-acetyltransferase n=1 Tax=Nocardioides pocheonensis TaxID=661485 RepID=A0A3N0GNI6_9ACTN|nr:GNAT family N-acetyltransferase [Nocardioides pocheonensis]RNM13660.1 GNAT family N-acetyltransferase [Nocardioides pocheonensis]
MTGVNHQLDHYVRGFRERVRVMRRPGQEIIEGPGLVGLIGGPDAVDGRVLVTDDRALDLFGERLPALNALVVTVFAGADVCHRLVEETGGYRADPATAMVCPDLATVPHPPLPEGLTLRPVGEPTESAVPLEQAAAAALEADSGASPVEELAGFVAYLRSIPHARMLAATDAAGHVRATSASAIFGRTAAVYFVNTDPGWRGRGVGTAMTAAALRAAADAGAKDAILDASALGHSLYQRLGFTSVSPNTLFVRTQ